MINSIKAKLGSRKPLDMELFDFLMEKKYTMKDIQETNKNITYRTINHWSENNYLLSKTNEGDWRKFSTTEYIWLLFLNELREMNVSFKKVLPVILAELGVRYDEWDNLDQAAFEEFKKLEWDNFIIKIDKEIVLENFCWELVKIISYKTPITARFFDDNSLKFIYGNPAYHGFKIPSALEKYEREVRESNFRSSISVSLDSLLNNFIGKEELDNISGHNILTKLEMQVLEQVRNNELSEITINLENGKPVRFLLTEKTNKIDAAKRIKESFRNQYEECIIKTQDGEHFTVSRTTKIKL